MITGEHGSGTGVERPEDRAAIALARVDALHTGLTQIVLEGGNLDGIAAEVARVLELGVLLQLHRRAAAGRRAHGLRPGAPGAARPAGPDRAAADRADRRDGAGRRGRGPRAAGRRGRHRPGPAGLPARRRSGVLRRRARAGAGRGGGGAADHPRGGGQRRREQVPGRLPARPAAAAHRRRGVRRGARGHLRLGPAPPGRGGGGGDRPAGPRRAAALAGPASAVAGAVLGGVAPGQPHASTRASRASTSPPR